MAAGLAWVSWQGWAALITFALQNGLAVLIMRWSKIRQPEPYSSQVAVLMQEIAIKLPISMVLYAKEVGGIRQCIVSIATEHRPGKLCQLLLLHAIDEKPPRRRNHFAEPASIGLS